MTIVTRCVIIMIRSFRDLEAKRLFEGRESRRLPPGVVRTALRKLVRLDSAVSLQDLAVPPGNRLERLRGDRSDGYSIRINGQWRICFLWRGSDVYEVEIVDYH